MTTWAKSFLTLTLLVMAGFLLAGCDMEVPEQVFKEGLDAYEKEGNMIHALVQFDKFLEKYPEHEWAPSVYLYKANCHLRLNQIEDALAACDHVIESSPGTNKAIDARFLKARIYASQEQWDKAIEVCRQLMEDMSSIPPVYQNAAMQLGEIYAVTGQWPEAIGVYDTLIESASVDDQIKPALYIYKGRSLVQAASPEMALETYTALRENYPDREEAIWGKVEMAKLKQTEDPAQARALLEEAVEEYKVQQQEIARQLAEATGALQTQGFQGGQPTMKPEDLARVDIESKIASAYSYLGYYDAAIARVDEIKNMYLHEPRVYQFLDNQLKMLQAMQEAEEANIDGATEEAGAAVAAPIGSVSP